MKNNSKYFNRFLTNLRWAGVQVYDMDNPYINFLHKIYSVIFLGLFGYGYIITEIIHIWQHMNELEELTLTLCYLSGHAIGIGKVALIIVKRKSIGRFISSLEQGLFLPNEERGGAEEKNILARAVERTSLQGKIFAFAVTIMISSRALQIIFNSKVQFFDKERNATVVERIYPYPSTLPFNVGSYGVEFVYELFCISLFGWYLGNCDCIITGLMIHVTAQFKIVSYALRTITQRAKISAKIHERDYMSVKLEAVLDAHLKVLVKDCVEHHCDILDLLENMENTFSEILLLQFLGTLLAMCVGLYQSSLVPITNPTFTAMSLFTLAMTFQLLTYCWNGNELSLHSVRVADAAFDCDWLHASREFKLALTLIIQRAHRSSFLTAGKYSRISLETFTSILRGSVSYFMMLRKIHEDELNYQQEI